MEMGEETRDFLESNRGSSAAAAGAATAEQKETPSYALSKQPEALPRNTSAAASAVQPAAPADAPSEKPSASSSPSPLEQKVIDEALKKCFDPEIPVNIWELGLIYDVAVSPQGVATVKMTLTAPACPVAGSLPGEIEQKIKTISGITDAKVELVWDPPWNTEMMSRVAKVMLGM